MFSSQGPSTLARSAEKNQKHLGAPKNPEMISLFLISLVKKIDKTSPQPLYIYNKPSSENPTVIRFSEMQGVLSPLSSN